MIKVLTEKWGSKAPRLAAVLILGIIVSWVAIKISLNRPDLGSLKPGSIIQSDLGAITLEEFDFVSGPSEIGSHKESQRFFLRQNQLEKILDGRQDFPPYSFSNLSSLFWIQFWIGLGAFFISGWIWAIRPLHMISVLHALGGFCIFIFALSSAIYTAREFAISEFLLRALVFFHCTSLVIFGIGMTFLFLISPRKLSYWKKIGFGFSALLILLSFVRGDLILSFEMLGIGGLLGTQFVLTKGHPEERAFLLWSGLSVTVAFAVFILFS